MRSNERHEVLVRRMRKVGVAGRLGREGHEEAVREALGQALGGLVGARLVKQKGDRMVRATVLVVVSALAIKIGLDIWKS